MMIQKLLANSSVSNYAALAAIAQKIVHASACTIYTKKRHKMIPVYAVDFSTKHVSSQNQLFKNVLTGRKVSRLSVPIQQGPFLYIPLLCGVKRVGIMVMAIFPKEKNLSRKNTEILKMYGAIAGLVMQRLELEKELYLAKKIQESMVNTTTHNLRTPLTSLAVYVRLFKKKEKDKQKLLWLQGITIASQRLAQVADDLARKKRCLYACPK